MTSDLVRSVHVSTRMRSRPKTVLGVSFVGLLVAACGAQSGIGVGSPLAGAVGNVACPELLGGAMNATFDSDARANATIRAFVTASGDLAETAARVQADVLQACERMATDLDVPQGERAPRDGQSPVAASCGAVTARIDAILKKGVSAQVRSSVTPPQCEVNADAQAACRGQCSGQASAQGQGAAQGQVPGQSSASGSGSASADARCESSCKAHADLTARCTEARVQVQGTVDTGEVGKVIATMQRNLPALVTAQIAYGQRIAGDVDVLVRTGSELPRAFGDLSAKAGACIAAAANATYAAQVSLRVSVQASARVSATAGASGG